MSIGIYKISNLINGKIYIGQSVHIEKRWQQHCNNTGRSLIAKAIQKYGKDSFSFQIIEECKEEELNAKEEYYIRKYNSIVPNGYNIQDWSNGNRRYFLNYSKEIFENIVMDIKQCELTFEEISLKYDLDLSMIYYINRGDYHTLENEIYPLRQVQDFSKKEHFCIDCGREITKGATRCVACDHKRQQKCEHPNRDELKSLIRSTPFVKIGKKFGVTDNTIRKWCKNYNLPSKSKEIKNIKDEEWEKI